MAPESPRKRLPFEPGSKGSGKSAADAKPAAKSASVKRSVTPKAVPSEKLGSTRGVTSSNQFAKAAAIPEVVSGRMLRRMLAFSGIPTVLGILTFFISYYLVTNRVVELPSYFVLLVTLGCFGLGVVGLTYGVLSASWDEDRAGSWLGLDEFRVNLGRMTSAWGAKPDS